MPRIPRKKASAGPQEELLIGLDGGATEVKAHEVRIVGREPELRLELGAASASIIYDRVRGFRPVPMPTQLAELAQQRPAASEAKQAQAWVDAAVRAIVLVSEDARRSRVRVGLCLPGIKTPDGRGVAVMRNGPRIPDYLTRVEAGLKAAGLDLAAPIPPLLSDGDACAHGESLALEGQLCGIANAYCLGGGTGLAEALKLDGAVVGLGELDPALPKAWQLEDEFGISYEDRLSARGINASYAKRAGLSLPLEDGRFPEQAALRGDPDAQTVLALAAASFGQLCWLRIQALAPRVLLERIVVGQRLGSMFADPELAESLRLPAERALARSIQASGDARLIQHYLEQDTLRPDLVVVSTLRAAPALGAAAWALAGGVRV